jgi:DEAD/DEAH box helicase domain-containing protein
VDRLYSWLRGQDGLTLFHFTSETPENARRANEMDVPSWEGCRFRTRQQARGLETADGRPLLAGAPRGPVPDIVITNYSMLEYMLCRPQDAVFFGPELRSIVLDEAHLYTGTLAAEIALLLRRVYDRCRVAPDEVMQIATSATLGLDDGGELAAFAARLFTKREESVHVIAGKAERARLGKPAPPEQPLTAAAVSGRQWLTTPTITVGASGEPELVSDESSSRALAADLELLTSPDAVPSDERCLSAVLFAALRRAPVVHEMEALLWEGRHLPLPELAQRLWRRADSMAVAATAVLLRLGAAARPAVGSYPLLPHRIHLLVRPADGFVACLNADCCGPERRRLPGLGVVSAGTHDTCPACGSAVLTLVRCPNCGVWQLAGSSDPARYSPLPPFTGAIGHEPSVVLSPVAQADQAEVVLDRSTGEKRGQGFAGISLWVLADSTCPRCGERPEWRTFETVTALSQGIVAETVLAELPSFPAPFSRWLPARGRRLLAFSDSRREAARLGPRLMRQHETQLFRAALTECLRGAPAAEPEVVSLLETQLAELDRRLADPAAGPAVRRLMERQQRELAGQLHSMLAGGDLDSWRAALGASPLLEELLAAEEAANHQPGYWLSHPDDAWARNGEQVRRHLLRRLARELASPLRGTASVETLGLAEVTYPGLDALSPPDELLGTIGSAGLRRAISGCWPLLVAALCDTLRSDGVVTLGSDEADGEYQSGGARIGRWTAAQHHWGSSPALRAGGPRPPGCWPSATGPRGVGAERSLRAAC